MSYTFPFFGAIMEKRQVRKMEHKEYLRISENAKTAVLFIHGIAGTPNHFRDFIPLVPEDFSVYNLLLDGHGGTPSDFSESSMKKWENQVKKAVDFLLEKHERIYIAAHSLGTLLAIEAAVREKRIEKLFFLAVPIKIFVKPTALFSAFRIYLGNVPEDDLRLNAMKNCCGINLSKNPFAYPGWIPRFLELFEKVGRTKKILPELRTECRIFQSAEDELVSPESYGYLKKHTDAKVEKLGKSGHYYYEENDFSYLKKEFSGFISEGRKQE